MLTNKNNIMSSKKKAGPSSSSSSAAVTTTAESNSLVVLVLDVSPMTWGEHDLKRKAQDKARTAAGKRSVGPAILEEALDSVMAFGNALLCCLERDSAFIVIGVADNETAIIYPRKNALAGWLNNPDNVRPDTRDMKEDIIIGVHELVSKAAVKVDFQTDPASRYAAMASGFSTALCVINRFLVASKAGGVSALRQEHYMERVDDDGVIALMGKDSAGKKKKLSSKNKRISAWDPRILLIQSSDDRSRDYNAFMNCTFAAAKHQIVIDGCFLSSSSNTSKSQSSSSAFLEQAVDLTGGVFLAPSGAAQVGGALTEILFSVFLPPLRCRPILNLPALNKVDFRARCFETGTLVDMAYVCNQCLCIVQTKPTTNFCPTCQAPIIDPATSNQLATSSSSSKRQRQDM
jgi:transcription initiation factor TFIIH subunit 3